LRFAVEVRYMQSWFYTLTPIFLPLSSLWAAASIENETTSGSKTRVNTIGGSYRNRDMNDSKSRGKSIFSEKSITITESEASPKPMNQGQLFDVEYSKSE
jgi:hypothetical protein